MFVDIIIIRKIVFNLITRNVKITSNANYIEDSLRYVCKNKIHESDVFCCLDD